MFDCWIVEWLNNQTIKQSNNQTIKQSNNQTIQQSNNTIRFVIFFLQNCTMRIILCFTLIFLTLTAKTQIKKAPEVKDGEGPWSQLIIRGIILVNGTGAPPAGPVDIVIEKNRIV